MIFLIKTLLITVVVLNLLQISWDGKKLEEHFYDLVTRSEKTKPIRDLGEKGAKNIDYVLKNKDQFLKDKKPEKIKENLIKTAKKMRDEGLKKAKKVFPKKSTKDKNKKSSFYR